MKEYSRVAALCGAAVALTLVGVGRSEAGSVGMAGEAIQERAPAVAGVLGGLEDLQPRLEQRRRGGGARRAVARRATRPFRGRPVRGRTVIVNRSFYRPYLYGYPYYGYGYYPGYYPGYWGGYYGYYGGAYSYTGSVRLKVKPNEADVLIDGYFVGKVDEFDGVLQSLKLEPGPKRIEIRSPGYEPLSVDVRILPGRKITYEANMRAADPGQVSTPPTFRPAPAGPPQDPPVAGSAAGSPAGSAAGSVVQPEPPLDRDPAGSDRRGDALDGRRNAPPRAGDRPAPPGSAGDYDRGYPDRVPAFGGVRLRVDPKQAQVFVDGYFVGIVDDFDGGRGLPLEAGPQNIEIRAPGYDPLPITVRILPDETITYEGSLVPSGGR